MKRFITGILLFVFSMVFAAGITAIAVPKIRNLAPETYSSLANLTGTKVNYRSKATAEAQKEAEEKLAKKETGEINLSGKVSFQASKKGTTPKQQTNTSASENSTEGGAFSADEDPGLNQYSDANNVVIVEEEDEGPDPRGALNEDPGLPMGIMAHKADGYDGSMNVRAHLTGGTVLAIGEEREYTRGKIYLCNVLLNRKWQKTKVWVYEEDMLRFDVTYAEAPRRERDAIVDYCAAKSRYDELAEKEKEKIERRSSNPYEEEYQRAYEKHEELARRIKENAEKIQYSQFHTDPKRGQYLKEGRELRDEQLAEKKTFDPIYKKWKDWEDSHPSVEEDLTVKETAEMKKCREKMEELAPIVREIFPAL